MPLQIYGAMTTPQAINFEHMIQLAEKAGRTTCINGIEHLFFSGYSYLGLGLLPEFTARVAEGLQKYGVVHPSSRVSNTPLNLYDELETALAAFTGSEAAACFSSGFLSARTAVETVAQQMPVYATAQTHPASTALSGIRTMDPSCSWGDFLAQRAAAGEYRFALASDSINPTPGHINDFSFLAATDPQFELVLLVDDSHGIGWMGTSGTGIRYLLELPANIELLLHFSLSKSFHLNGGAVCGSTYWIQRIKQHVNFATSTPFMPALAYAWLQSRELCNLQRQKLLQNIHYLQNRWANTTFVTNEGTPVFVVHKKALEPYLLQQHVIISSFSYPHPNLEPVNRVVVNALHTKSDLEKLATLVMDFE